MSAEASAEAIRIYCAAISLSRKTNQIVGEKSDYYVTLEQLETICKSSAKVKP